jgi:hypothetical protein
VQSDSRTDRRETPPPNSRVSLSDRAGTQPLDWCRADQTTGRRGSASCRPNNRTSRLSFVSTSIAAHNQDCSPLILTAVSSTATPDGCAAGGSQPLSERRCTQFQTAPCERSTPNSAKIVAVSLTEQPVWWRRTANALMCVAVRLRSQTSSKSPSYVSLSRSASILGRLLNDLLVP